MDPTTHDRQIAVTIGLPHLLAFAANALAKDVRLAPELVGGSWESLTRVAVSDPEMVAGFLGAQAPEQRRIIQEFKRLLDRIEHMIASGSDEQLRDALAHWQSPAK